MQVEVLTNTWLPVLMVDYCIARLVRIRILDVFVLGTNRIRIPIVDKKIFFVFRYHSYCVGLDEIPSGRWHCVECSYCMSCESRFEQSLIYTESLNLVNQGLNNYLIIQSH